MLADRAAEGEFVDPREIDTETVGMDDDEFLAASGVDPEAVSAAERRADGSTNRSRSRRRVVLDGLEDLEEPTTADLVQYAADAGVGEAYVERALEKLARSGEITRTNDGYRKL